MSRPLRVNLEGGWYHVFVRGLDRMAVFRDDRDRRHLLGLFEAAVQRYRIELHAFALLDGHFHLVARTPDANLSRAMQWLNQSYAAWFNTRRQRKGTVFQRPFGSVPIEDGAWAYELSLYVHLNPLRIKRLGLSARERKGAGLGLRPPVSPEQIAARLQKLREYPWSSYRAYAGYVRAPWWLQSGEIWARASRRKAQRTKAYRTDAQDRVAEGGDATRREALRDRIAIGSAAFVQRVRALGAQGGRNREIAGKRRLRERVTMEQVIEAVAHAKGEAWEKFRDRRGDPGPALAMWVARQCTGLTLREIGAAVGGKDYAAAAMAIRRIARRLCRENSLQKQAARVAQLLNVKMSPP